MKHISFDIEISDEFEVKQGEDLLKYAPFHISVAAAVDHTGASRLWHSTGEDGKPAVEMSQERARELLAYLVQMQQEGWKLFAWNGLNFDLRWIGHNAGDMETAACVALGLYDPMFQFFNQRGFPIGLAAVGDAMGVPQTKLLNAADAPREWRNGNHQRVMDYVVGDCQITNQVVAAIAAQRAIRWRTKKGTLSFEAMPRFKTVAEVLRDPEPDQSWMMGGGMKRKGFIEWFPEGVRISVDPAGKGIPNRVIVVFVGLQVLDVLTTVLGLSVGAHEGNYLVAQFMVWGPALGLLIAKFLGFLLLLVAFAAGKLRMLRLLNLWFLCIVAWNLAIIWIQILIGPGK